MTTTYYTNNAIISGASVIGKSHILNGTCNQDSFVIKKNKLGVVLGVCDGIGSNKFSQFGSKAACKALYRVFNIYSKNIIDKATIGRTIERYYKKYVKKKYQTAAGTTCLFAFLLSNNEIIIGQCGDGVILIKEDSKFIVFHNKTDDFLNEVSALSCKHDYNGWKIRNLKFSESQNEILQILLSTDGISEDIIPEKREAFMEYFMELSSKKNSGLKKELLNWSVPGSIDDKTVITFNWRKL